MPFKLKTSSRVQAHNHDDTFNLLKMLPAYNASFHIILCFHTTKKNLNYFTSFDNIQACTDLQFIPFLLEPPLSIFPM